jgi:UDPglucose--hexose-1-phosphate uridylyltransferase
MKSWPFERGELRLDPLTGRWVVVNTARAHRPQPFISRVLPVQADPDRPCPFCPGNEEETPPALETFGPSGSWLVRVVPNLYPIFSGDDPLVVDHLGPVFSRAPASGIHEVLVLSPEHNANWASLPDEQVDLVMEAIAARLAEHARSTSLRYSQVIVNSGREAGASLEHPHGQLLGISFVPRELADEQAGFARFSGSCLLCTTAKAEAKDRRRLVSEGHGISTICPYWSGVPFEMLILPLSHQAHLHHATAEELSATGRAIRDALARLHQVAGDVAYNLVFHSAPYRSQTAFHWHVHILPKLTTMAGFELGTGVMVNVVSPEQASEELRCCEEAKKQGFPA